MESNLPSYDDLYPTEGPPKYFEDNSQTQFFGEEETPDCIARNHIINSDVVTTTFNHDSQVVTDLPPVNSAVTGEATKPRGPAFLGIVIVFLLIFWFSKTEDDGKLGGNENWVVKIFTSDMRSAGTNANVFVQVYDVTGKRSEEIPLDNKSDNFESGQVDRFTLDLPPDFAELYKLRIWHDGSRPFSGWHLDRIELARSGSDVTYEFFCGKWLATDEDDGEIVRELPATGSHVKSPGSVKDYKAIVKTGDSFGAGTDANVFLVIYGLGDTGKRALENNQNRNKFERGNADEFLIKAVDLAEIDHIQIGHDNWGGNAGWFLGTVDIVDCATSVTKTFICDRWLDERKEDGKLIRDRWVATDEDGQQTWRELYDYINLYPTNM